ncbi:MAG TPA: hypothetical protein VNT81_23680 [Vicinamibacterales bacterium]|nr:hypothetical protein [Vicinamibacterales bacterium]
MDERGRLLGRFNVVDLAALILLVALLPLSYAASLLFQPARPTIESVGQTDITNAERRIVAGGSLLSAKLKVRGTGFTPMLRAYVGDEPALAFVFETPNSADVLVGPLPPGPHDLSLRDGVQEVARAAGAVKIEAPSPRILRAEGWLTNMSTAVAAELKAADMIPKEGPQFGVAMLGPVVPAQSRIRLGEGENDFAIANHVERRAVVYLRCDPGGIEFLTGQEECTFGGQAVRGATPVHLILPFTTGAIGFSVYEVFPPVAPQRARITVRLDPDIAGIQPGDRDSLLDDRSAKVVSKQGNLVTLELGVDAAREGWRYRGRVVRTGGEFSWATPQYEARGFATALTVEPAR